ncbi:MAG: L-threonylcarbamoyladenylate synthase [Tissierellia bacterium]|nr:L-threonylcarbamoyladenylate synthase [Tissierellia bacterium]
METKILTIQSAEDGAAIAEAAEALKSGKLVIFPTETVYGLGADALNETAVDGIFTAKGRPRDNPLIVHIAHEDQVLDLVSVIPPKGKDCMDIFWPGPLTLIFNRSELVPNYVTAGLDSVAIRMPDHPVARSILQEANIPVVAPSANTSGRPSPTTADHVVEDMMGKVDLIIDGGHTGVGIESTVLDVTVDPPMILRPGGITREDLEAIIGPVDMDETILPSDSSIIPKSPGQKYKHYAPRGEAYVFAGNIIGIAGEINRRVRESGSKKTAVLATTETLELYRGMDLLVNMGSRDNLKEVAHNIFDALRCCDDEGMEVIFIEGFELEGMGVSIMNRLLKAAGGKVILGL